MVRMSAPISISCSLRLSLWNPASGQPLRKNFPIDDVRCANLPFVVTNGDVLEHRVAMVIERVRDNLLSLVRECGVDLSDQFSAVVATLHLTSPQSCGLGKVDGSPGIVPGSIPLSSRLFGGQRGLKLLCWYARRCPRLPRHSWSIWAEDGDELCASGATREL